MRGVVKTHACVHAGSRALLVYLWADGQPAVQEFNTVEAAQALMESDARDRLSINGRALTLDYSISQYGSRDAQAGNLADWICTMCQAVNFAR